MRTGKLSRMMAAIAGVLMLGAVAVSCGGASKGDACKKYCQLCMGDPNNFFGDQGCEAACNQQMFSDACASCVDGASSCDAANMCASCA